MGEAFIFPFQTIMCPDFSRSIFPLLDIFNVWDNFINGNLLVDFTFCTFSLLS